MGLFNENKPIAYLIKPVLATVLSGTIRCDLAASQRDIFKSNTQQQRSVSLPHRFLWCELPESPGATHYYHGLTLMPARISSHMPCKVWDAITYLFPNFNSSLTEVSQRINYLIPRFIMDVITYQCLRQ